MGPHAPDNKDHKSKGVNPCSEQTLESYELCCLVECYLNRHTDMDDFMRTLKFAYLYSKTVTLGTSHWPETNRVMLRNRRIGCSLTGITQFLARENIETLRVWLNHGYDTIQKYDIIYSDWFCIPRSIKTTTIKPSGCVVSGTEIIGEDGNPITMYDIFKDNGIDLMEHTLTKDTWFDVKPAATKNNIINKDGATEKISKLYIKGVDTVYAVNTDHGIIYASAEHKFMTSTGWKSTLELVPGDKIAEH
jgi:hypothetical protein